MTVQPQARPSLLLPPMIVKIRSKGAEIKDVEVLDLSLAGCMVRWRGWRVQEAQRVLISFPTLANLPATILWSEDDRLGLEFERALHEAVFEHLAQGYRLG